MKLPAIKASIGKWTYYLTVLTFEQISKFVEKIDDNLYESAALRDLLQRSITKNYLSIKEYILHQPDLFFNSIVLAVYNDYPDWQQIVVKFEDGKFNQLGLLDFPGHHKIFPIDGQHRVEGIKEAIKDNPTLKTQQIGVIFIGHKHDAEGKKRTRRLFTTLNRYAKPVSLRDGIALDEDDTVAITTRTLLEDFKLFQGDKVIDVKGKAIPRTNTRAFTSIITFYQCNLEMFKVYYEEKFDKKATKKNIDKYLKFRPSEESINEFKAFSLEIWEELVSNTNSLKVYLDTEITPAEQFRNSTTGGNLLFRPVGLLPFIKASCEIHKRANKSFKAIFRRFNQIEFNINQKPWVSVMWNDLENKMIMNTGRLTYLLLIYKFNPEILNEKEIKNLEEGYAVSVGANIENIKKLLKTI